MQEHRGPVVLAVKFESLHAPAALVEICQADIERLRAVPGLVEKFFLSDPESGALCGVHLFASERDREAYVGSRFFAAVAERYAVRNGSLRLERYDVFHLLNDGIALPGS
jgi:hypothetical protein